MMGRLTLLLVIFISGCASRDFTVTLFRTGRATGVSESYSINGKGMGMKVIEIPGDTDSRCWRLPIDRKIIADVRSLLQDSLDVITAIELHATGELTTGILIDKGTTHQEMTWPNIDPPLLGTAVVDSLHHLMLRAQVQMNTP